MQAANLERTSEPPARQEICPLCGYSFDADGQGCRPACPLAPMCHLICCPRCLYSFPQEKGLAAALRRWLGRRKAEEH